jgi:chemotaxis protein CheD
MALPSLSERPATLPGFDHVKRAWNLKLESWVARILPGEYYVTRSEEGISTTLGSCISACIRDRVQGIGGMNHFMLPASANGELDMSLVSGIGSATRYGNYAMEHLINGIMRNGGRRENLEVKIFGGGRIMENMTDVGARNIRFVREYLALEGLKVVAEDVGEVFPRMVVYFPQTGRVKVKRLRSLHNNVIADQEKRYIETVVQKPVAGDIELF